MPVRRARAFRIAVLLAVALLTGARAETFPLPNGLIAFDSEQGQTLFLHSEANKSYFPLGLYFVTQDNPAFCGPASIAMVLNALHVPRPPSKLTLGLGLYDQENIFDAKSEAIKTRTAVMQSGMTLDELGKIFAAHDLKVAVYHAGDSNLDEFRRLAEQRTQRARNASFLSTTCARALARASRDISHRSRLTTKTVTVSLFSMCRATIIRQFG